MKIKAEQHNEGRKRNQILTMNYKTVTKKKEEKKKKKHQHCEQMLNNRKQSCLPTDISLTRRGIISAEVVNLAPFFHRGTVNLIFVITHIWCLLKNYEIDRNIEILK